VVSCSVTPSLYRSLQPPAPTKCTDHISCLAQSSASAVLFAESAHCCCPSIRILFHALAVFSLLNQKRLLCLHIGHCPLEESCLIHSRMQCYSHQLRPRHRTRSLLTIWKLCPHLPETGVCVSFEESGEEKKERLRKGQSSPGYLHVGHVPSKWTWQMPQTSSSGISHCQIATAYHVMNLTFILTVFPLILGTLEFVVRYSIRRL
jgi:hypothetical protein